MKPKSKPSSSNTESSSNMPLSNQNNIHKSILLEMMNEVSNGLQIFLDNTTYIYNQNEICYSVKHLHSDIMNLVKPPKEFTECERNSTKDLSEKEPFTNDKTTKEFNRENKKPREWESSNFYTWPRHSELNQKVQQIEKEKGHEILKDGSKYLRKIIQGKEAYEKRRERMKNPQYVPISREKKLPKPLDNLDPLEKKALHVNKQRGRVIDCDGFETQTLNWAKEKIARGQKLKRADLMNYYRNITNGKFTGSTAWCGRFVKRHPVLKNYFNNYLKFEPTIHEEVHEEDVLDSKGNLWIRPESENEHEIDEDNEEEFKNELKMNERHERYDYEDQEQISESSNR